MIMDNVKLYPEYFSYKKFWLITTLRD
jgi:hypothetical protein